VQQQLNHNKYFKFAKPRVKFLIVVMCRKVLHCLAQKETKISVPNINSTVRSSQNAPAISPVSEEELNASIDAACTGVDPSLLVGSDCVALCSPGFCCFDDNSSGCPQNCQTYANCVSAFQSQQQQVNATGVTSVAISGSTPVNSPINDTGNKGDLVLKQQIDAICGTAIETVSPPGEDSCETLCGPAYCCFDHLCVPLLDLDCLEYSACYVLYANVDNVEEDISAFNLGDEVHQVCEGLLDVNDAINNVECNSICSPGACCFEDKLSCSNVDCAM
jgi:hypothetical protein